MSYRRLSEAELQTFAEEWNAYQAWRAYAAYATDIYGLAAERVDVVASPERSDEFSYLVIEEVAVYDARGRLLDPDMSTDWWQTRLAEAHDLDDEDACEDWLSDVIGERRAALPVLGGGYDTYLISKPPHRSHRALFAPE
jgi:hypothetical protein